MYCLKCGNEVKPEQKFCSKCGGSISEIQAPIKGLVIKKNIMIITVIVVVFLIVFTAIKFMGKSDKERILGTWVLVEEVYNGPRTEDIGVQIIFRDGGLIYDEEEFLRGHLNAGTIVSWDILEDNDILLFTNNWGEQFSTKYEFAGNRLKIIDGSTYCIWEKQ